jgi:DNA gyrase subunit A
MPIIVTPIIKSLKEEFKPYAQDIILNNLPMIDGLLLSHKKVLWGMYKKGTLPDKPFIKNIKNQGSIVEYYVYGDMPLAKVMVNMANNGMNVPYLEWDGNSGDKYRKDGKAASARYTGARITPYGVFMLKGIEKNAVPMKPNYDNSSFEPILAPSIAPNILINNSESIAISEASKIPPHNINSLCKSIIHYLKTKNIDESIDILECPDFCNHGKIIYDKDVFMKIYKEGKGSFSLIGRYTYNKEKGILSIVEVPYTTTIDAIESAITKQYQKGKFKEVLDIRNASGKDGLKLNISLKKNTNINEFEKQLRKLTPFESKYSCNFTILGLDYIPYLMNLEDIYSLWIRHRINCITNEINFDINKNNEKLHELYGLENIILNLDEAIKICRYSKSNKIAIDSLKSAFNLSDIQAEYISNIRLINLNEEYLTEKTSEIKSLVLNNENLNSLLNENIIKQTIIAQLEEFSLKYSMTRKTEIVFNNEVEEVSKEDLIEDYTTTLVLTKEQYIKKTQKYSDKQTTKEGDEVLQIIQTTNKKDLLIFTNQGRLFTRKIYELTGKIECTASGLGEYIPNIIKDLNKDEKIIYIASPEIYDKGYMLYIFENNSIVKMNMKPYENKQNRKVAQDAYNPTNNLKYIKYITDDIDMFITTNEGKSLILNTSQVNPLNTGGKKSLGNSFIKLDSKKFDDNGIASIILEPKADSILNVITEKKDFELKLNDLADNGKMWFEYLQGSKNNTGTFIYNCRQKNDRVIDVKLI